MQDISLVSKYGHMMGSANWMYRAKCLLSVCSVLAKCGDCFICYPIAKFL